MPRFTASLPGSVTPGWHLPQTIPGTERCRRSNGLHRGGNHRRELIVRACETSLQVKTSMHSSVNGEQRSGTPSLASRVDAKCTHGCFLRAAAILPKPLCDRDACLFCSLSQEGLPPAVGTHRYRHTYTSAGGTPPIRDIIPPALEMKTQNPDDASASCS